MKLRKSVRLKYFDYSRAGNYFITICTHERCPLFGQIENELVVLNKLGLLVKEEWLNIPVHFPHAALDEYVVMPNHLHGILYLNTEDTASCVTTRSFGHVQSQTIPVIVRAFKSGVTRKARTLLSITQHVWQPNYYEHVIRTERRLSQIRKYISENPLKWALDPDHFEPNPSTLVHVINV
ncbi:hypothetical protein EHM69_05050 [candidate division KSB1 bacterium]|nr:MAG: hypothetical protein EHM69_05050 [candidate division KSB1 bacterium]